VGEDIESSMFKVQGSRSEIENFEPGTLNLELHLIDSFVVLSPPTPP
jgi:hypothetical protein